MLWKVLVVQLALAAGITGNTYTSVDGFAITKPDDWQFSNENSVKIPHLDKNGGTIRYDGGPPLLVDMFKPMGRTPVGLQPRVQVSYVVDEPAGKTLLEKIQNCLRSFQEKTKALRVHHEPQETILGKVASTEFTNLALDHGHEIQVRRLIFFVRSSSRLYYVHIYCLESDVEKFRDVFTQIAGTIKFE
jgi:hypothetical protein